MSVVFLPFLVNILHISIEAAELVQEFSFVEILDRILIVISHLKAGLYSGPRLKTRVSELLSSVDNLSEHFVVFDPVVNLHDVQFFVFLQRVDLLVQVWIVHFGKEKDLDRQQQSEYGWFVDDCFADYFFETWKLADFLTAVLPLRAIP